ncbi:2-oxoglutarate synthase subunit alpha [Candidatus Nitrososphaera gargensis Ga9.2]|uniref:2-oxoacid oxidoreductase (ferredoxin) n=1 Tax=Nitrososphaera gargensis (strain Ga9.2) TaxID=1237085 RepID=K0IIN1_NITGG|nr:2-oxoglutarate synthase subunit alpha [Candidatus Nitrososphaera gargensis Ga9.2]
MEKTVTNSLSWVIGGAQGSGVDSAANIFSRACAAGGLHVFGKREYYSNIKGEHSYFTVRVSEKPVHSHVNDINVLVSFDAETVFRHFEEVTPGGAIIYDTDVADTLLSEVPTIDDHAMARIKKALEKAGLGLSVKDALEHARKRGVVLFPIPFFQILQEFAQKTNDPALSKLTRMVNVMALSASMAIMDFDSEVLARAIQFIFRAKKKVADLNVSASIHVYNYAKAKFAGSNNFAYRLKTRPTAKDLIIVQGNQSSALGKMVAGCRFQTYYPITPASDDSEFLEANEILDLNDSGKKGSTVVVQTEDEIAAIAMAIGSALTGARSATATSGPGFSLMAEALGWAGINEVPVVISLYQRAGPSTGLPTRHEQGDLNFAINAGHGEFPRIVLASGDIEESFYDTIKAFNLADRYQMPVIHMLDKAIANSVTTCRNFDPGKVKIDRGAIVRQVITEKDKGLAGNYLRFKLSSDGPISPRVVLGTKDAIFWNTGDEHTEEGHITEDPELRVQMMDKRMDKLQVALKEIPDEDKAVAYGDGDIAIVSWGSTKGAILDMKEKLAGEGIRIKFVQVRLMNPFPSELVKSMLKGAKTVIDIEMNYSGQLGSLVRQHTGIEADYQIVKYNGRPMSLDEIYNAVKRIMNDGGRNAPRRQVLKSGA